MARPQPRPNLPPATLASLPARASEALEQGRFKEAIDLFKQLVRQEPRSEWKAALDDAYCGRAHTLVAKQMFKEAAMVLENTRAADGSLREPLLYASCLIREGQHPKAAAQLLQAVCGASLPANQRQDAEDLLAALLTAAPAPPTAIGAETPERARWREGGAAAREALAAWTNGAPAEEIEQKLSRISLRSAFRPVRLLLKTLVAGPDATDRSRVLLDTIPPCSPFFPLRQAVEAALGAGFAPDGWNRLTPLQKTFVGETGGLPPVALEAVTRLSEASSAGPAALFAALLKRAGDQRSGLNQADLRQACLNLLPQIPDRIAQFERQFGRLSVLEHARIEALAAEAAENWAKAENAWRRAAQAIADCGTGQQENLSRAVIYRHIAKLSTTHKEICGVECESDPYSHYLQLADMADPAHVPTVLARIARYRALSRERQWHQLADEAAQRFPQDSQVLLQATQSAVARQAYKKAAGFARRLLAIDPVNAPLRRQMVELLVAQARKQLRNKRPDLAARELEEAGNWERADAPDALLCLFRGLVAQRDGKRDEGHALIRRSVDLAGGGVAGWFRAAMEAALIKAPPGEWAWIGEQLASARRSPPSKAAVQAVVASAGSAEALAGKKTVAPLLAGLRTWFTAAAALDWSLAEFQALEDTLIRYEMFLEMAALARAGHRREPGNQMWQFHEILARTHDDPLRMTMRETDQLNEIGEAAAKRDDAHALTRLRRYMRFNEAVLDDDDPDFDDVPDDLELDPDELIEMLIGANGPLPKDIQRDMRAKVGEIGREAAVTELAQVLAGPSGPAGPAGMPLKIARQVAAAMVKAALDGAGKRGRGGRF